MFSHFNINLYVYQERTVLKSEEEWARKVSPK
jgi:hypothetical protein